MILVYVGILAQTMEKSSIDSQGPGLAWQKPYRPPPLGPRLSAKKKLMPLPLGNWKQPTEQLPRNTATAIGASHAPNYISNVAIARITPPPHWEHEFRTAAIGAPWQERLRVDLHNNQGMHPRDRKPKWGYNWGGRSLLCLAARNLSQRARKRGLIKTQADYDELGYKAAIRWLVAKPTAPSQDFSSKPVGVRTSTVPKLLYAKAKIRKPVSIE